MPLGAGSGLTLVLRSQAAMAVKLRAEAPRPVVVWDFDNRSRYIDFNGPAGSVGIRHLHPGAI